MKVVRRRDDIYTFQWWVVVCLTLFNCCLCTDDYYCQVTLDTIMYIHLASTRVSDTVNSWGGSRLTHFPEKRRRRRKEGRMPRSSRLGERKLQRKLSHSMLFRVKTAKCTLWLQVHEWRDEERERVCVCLCVCLVARTLAIQVSIE